MYVAQFTLSLFKTAKELLQLLFQRHHFIINNVNVMSSSVENYLGLDLNILANLRSDILFFGQA